MDNLLDAIWPKEEFRNEHSYCRSEGFPLTGIFHPWAQWDMGLDTLGNSSAVAVAAPWGGREGFYKKV